MQTIKESEEKLAGLNEKKVEFKELLKGLREFTEIRELTPTIVNRTIQRIEIHKKSKSYSREDIQVDIYFTAIGLASVPDEEEVLKASKEARLRMEQHAISAI